MHGYTIDAKTIDHQAPALLRAVYGTKIERLKFPLDLNRVAMHCGLAIKQGPFKDQTIEGALDRKKATVYLSDRDTYEEKNFTLAHEIGHYKLHENIATDLFTMHELNNLLERAGEDKQEDEADLFAASLLMPEQPLRQLWKASPDVSQMTVVFGVPKAAVRFRLTNLGFL